MWFIERRLNISNNVWFDDNNFFHLNNYEYKLNKRSIERINSIQQVSVIYKNQMVNTLFQEDRFSINNINYIRTFKKNIDKID